MVYIFSGDNLGNVAYLIGLIIGLMAVMFTGATDNNTLHPCDADGATYVGADGHKIELINNINATDPSYAQLITFIRADHTDRKEYDYDNFTCGDYAEQVHNNAEVAGIKAGWVSIGFSDSTEGHACNAFNTTDRGMVFIDCTEADKKVIIVEGQDYIPDPLFRNNVYYESTGIVDSYNVWW